MMEHNVAFAVLDEQILGKGTLPILAELTAKEGRCIIRAYKQDIQPPLTYQSYEKREQARACWLDLTQQDVKELTDVA